MKKLRELFQYRGTKIRPRDQNLILQTVLGSALLLWFPLTILFYCPVLSHINIKTISWPLIRQLPWSYQGLIISLAVTLFCLILVVLLVMYKFPDYYRKLVHRQKIARMFMTNNWYEKNTQQSGGFFKDLDTGKTKERIAHFPRIYYRLKDGLIHVQVEIMMSSYQEQLLHLEPKLESGLYCEMVDKILHDSYVEYTLLYDTIAHRLSIDQVVCKDGAVKLMENVYWEYDALPHMLIAGGTGGGKTYFILTLIEALSKTNAKLTILDPKNADLADLEEVLPDVYYDPDDMLAALSRFYDEMRQRNTEMKKMDGYQTGQNYGLYTFSC